MVKKPITILLEEEDFNKLSKIVEETGEALGSAIRRLMRKGLGIEKEKLDFTIKVEKETGRGSVGLRKIFITAKTDEDLELILNLLRSKKNDTNTN